MVDSETTAAAPAALLDCSVGSIVWVRRRNGSWWPGKILGPDDLSSSIITSPRSGTPVKLLGREDASVDWYNLEKSKRVKSFRCGDFDECIERAEAAKEMPPKKREKYARREDAILHALELERQMLEKKYGKLGHTSNGRFKKSTDVITPVEHLEQGGGNQNNPRSDHISERLAEKSVTDILLRVETGREECQVSGDDDSPGALPRMRGLQDFGLLTAPPPREELSAVALRSKRSRYAYPQYDSGDSSHDNPVPPSRLQTTFSKFDGSGYLVNAGEDHISGSTEDTETDCSDTDSLESDSDDMMALSDGSLSIELRPKYPRRIETFKEHGSMSSTDDFDGFTSADDASHPSPYDPVSSSTGMSKWQLKGKRNNRILGKRYLDITEPDISRGYINGKTSNWNTSGLKADLVNKSGRSRISRQGTGGLKGSDCDYMDIDGLALNNQFGMREYWEDLQEDGDSTVFASRQHMGGRIMLVDVDLKVKANNYRRDVPMISLTSKLNGHSIIGHPIQVEALESGSTDKLLKAAGYFSPESLESPTALRPVWRTGRRTANSRVPRPRFVDENKKLVFSRNLQKKTSPSSNRKVKTLSSIPLEQKHHNNLASGCMNSEVDGLMKTAPTAVACIPVKLVFSRLHEELIGRHQ